MDLLRELFVAGYRIDYCCDAAARAGHLEVVKWARANGCNWGAQTCAFAAEKGHLKILKWMHENGCEWDAETCRTAAEGGYVYVCM